MNKNVLFFPVNQKSDLESLNDDEIVSGYLMGIKGRALPCEYTRSLWHGWRNGMADARKIPIDEHMRRLIIDVNPKLQT